MPRYYRRRAFSRARKRSNYVWVRGAENNVTPVSQPNSQTYDLLAVYRTTAGITLNIPEFTIWRIHIKISCQFGLTGPTAAANNAVLHSIFVEQASAAFLPNPVSAPYNERYLMWDNYYVAEQEMQSGIPVGAPGQDILVSYRAYDIRSHRRLDNLNDTLWIMLTPQGNVQNLTSSVTYSILLRQK